MFRPEGFSEVIFKDRYAFTPEETWEQATERVAKQMALAESPDKQKFYEDKFKEILKDAERHSLAKEFIDLKLFGRHSRPLIQFLSYCTDPFLPGLTAKEHECEAFLRNLGIEFIKNDVWLRYIDLSPEDKKKLMKIQKELTESVSGK
jgi:single-stranded DNA-specific DHH superfamily exonuclease